MKKSEKQQATAEDRPLITFALFTYNQEKYIREALEGAFSQTYSPLQIILSDDCSSDRTYEIMQEEAEKYSGPHFILLNRNPRNMGIGGHVSRVVDLAEGKLIVAAAGDDISFPERAEKLFLRWREKGKGMMSLHSSVIKMSEAGEEVGIYKTPDCHCTEPNELATKNVVIGASHAWSKELFNKFGGLNSEVVHEDRTIAFRASLMDGLEFIDEPLVRYRMGGISTKNQSTSREVSLQEELFGENIKVFYTRNYYDAVQSLKDICSTDLSKAASLKKFLESRRDCLFFGMSLAQGMRPITLLISNHRATSLCTLKQVLKYQFLNVYWLLKARLGRSA